MARTRTFAFGGLLMAVVVPFWTGNGPAAAQGVANASQPVPGLTYRFEKVAEGVFCAIASGTPYAVANSVVIIGETGVLVVDAGASPSQARVLRDGIRTLTDQPVRFLVDTHFHFDHAFGTAAFPEALTIGYAATRELLGPDALRGRTVSGFVAGLPEQIENARTEAAKEKDAGKRAELAQRISAWEVYQKELATLVPIAPTLTFADRLTLWVGSREVRFLHLGRGHTAGDVIVLLPRERVACTGDFFNGYVGYLGDAFVDEWAGNLDRLAALEFDTVVPGHGAPFEGKDRIAPVKACLRDLWGQAAALKRAGVPAERAAARIDLRSHASRFPRFTQLGIEPLAVRRIYEVIDERERPAHVH